MSTQNSEAKKKWRKLRKFIKEQKRSPLSTAQEIREQAAQLYEEFLASLPLRSRQLFFVSLKLDAKYPAAIPREKIPKMIRTNPRFFKDWAEAVGEIG